MHFVLRAHFWCLRHISCAQAQNTNRKRTLTSRLRLFFRQDILALTALTLSNLGIQYLHIFRCYEAQRIARKAAEMVDGAMPNNHPLVARILRVSDVTNRRERVTKRKGGRGREEREKAHVSEEKGGREQ